MTRETLEKCENLYFIKLLLSRCQQTTDCVRYAGLFSFHT